MQILNSKTIEEYKQEIENIINSYIIVKENLNGYTFYIEKKNNLIRFYKKYNNQPLTEIDLLYYKYYNIILDHFKKVIDLNVLKKIKNNYLFKFKFIENSKNNKNYEILLLYIKDLEKNEIIEHSQNNNEYIEWSNIFQTKYVPVIFEGYLDEEKKEKIRDYINNSAKYINLKYNTNDFIEFFINTLNPDYNYSDLFDNKSEFIKNISIFVKNNNKYYNYILLNNIANEIISQNKEEKNTTIHIILSDILEFISIYLFKFKNQIKLKSTNTNDKFIELLCILYNEYINQKISKYTDNELSIFYNKYTNLFFSDNLKINTELIKNKDTKEILSKRDEYNIIFQIFLDIFREKKKLSRILDKNFLEFENFVIDQFYNLIDSNKDKVEFNKIILTFE